MGVSEAEQLLAEVIDVDAALAAAEAEVPGGVVAEVELEGTDTPVWEVTLEEAGREFEVELDAISGAVLSVEDEGAIDEDRSGWISLREARDAAAAEVPGTVLQVELGDGEDAIYEVIVFEGDGFAEVEIDALLGTVIAVDRSETYEDEGADDDTDEDSDDDTDEDADDDTDEDSDDDTDEDADDDTDDDTDDDVDEDSDDDTDEDADDDTDDDADDDTDEDSDEDADDDADDDTDDGTDEDADDDTDEDSDDGMSTPEGGV
ncbi:MAG: PepSY domain-containing protein [Myxococcota bacterium]